MSDQVPLYQKQERAGWMFSDCLALAFMAFVFIFALVCIMLERRNCNTSVFSSKKRQKKWQEAAKEWLEAIAKIITLLLGEDPKNTATTKVTTRVEE